MLAQHPNIAGACDRFGGRVRDGIRRVVRNLLAVVSIGQQSVQFILGDPDQPKVEIFGQQRLQFL